jgi:uncharacterized repeat protein (TIGR03803 family)
MYLPVAGAALAGRAGISGRYSPIGASADIDHPSFIPTNSAYSLISRASATTAYPASEVRFCGVPPDNAEALVRSQPGGLIMQSKKHSTVLTAALAIFALALLLTGPRALAQTEKVVHNFGNGKDGVQPRAGLIFDASGNLYGTTLTGGADDGGTAFELSPKTGGGWTEKILHSFQNNGKDGYWPHASLILDAKGNLYGTTYQGGTGLCTSNSTVIGCGVVFELSPKTGGGWTEKILHSFSYGTDGNYPYGSLVFDAKGNLYGTTYGGGANTYYGTVFELVPKASGPWAEKVLHSFNDNRTDGYYPYCNLVFDAARNLYGTTSSGGSLGDYGVVFELTPGAGGTWTETILHGFLSNTNDGITPNAGVILDSAGNLYGTTTGGGVYGYGTAFELSPKTGGGWTETVLYSFGDTTNDGQAPYADLIFNGGNLYGTTAAGGPSDGGTAFELVSTAGSWTETVLYSFSDGDGGGPEGGVIFDTTGNLYGTTTYGGTNDAGTVFEVTP